MISVPVSNLVLTTAFATIGMAMTFFWTFVKGGEAMFKGFHRWVERRQARKQAAEAELDRQQDELRATILRLAEALGIEAHEARKALIRESFLTSGTLPERPER